MFFNVFGCFWVFGFWVVFGVRERSSIMSAHLGGVGGPIKNADTADAGEGGGGVSDEMLTLLILGSGRGEKSWLTAEIKRK